MPKGIGLRGTGNERCWFRYSNDYDNLMSIANFLKLRENDTSRERMYYHWLVHKLRLEAAKTGINGYYLEVFEPEVDRSGFDLVLNDGTWERHIQLKTVLSSAKTKQWELNYKLLLPGLDVGKAFELEPMCTGLGGGFLLLEIDDQTGEVIGTSYVDYLTLTAQELKLTSHSAPAARAVLKKLNDPNLGKVTNKAKKGVPSKKTKPGVPLKKSDVIDQITIRRTVLMPLKELSQVLGIMGLDNTGDVKLFPHQVIKAWEEEKNANVHKQQLRGTLKKLLL